MAGKSNTCTQKVNCSVHVDSVSRDTVHSVGIDRLCCWDGATPKFGIPQQSSHLLQAQMWIWTLAGQLENFDSNQFFLVCPSPM